MPVTALIAGLPCRLPPSPAAHDGSTPGMEVTPMMRMLRGFLPLLLLLLVPAPVPAQEITVGGSADASNSFPFTFYHFRTPNRYQQLYTASRFPDAVFIDAIRFSNTRATASGLPGPIAEGEYLVRLGITDRP